VGKVKRDVRSVLEALLQIDGREFFFAAASSGMSFITSFSSGLRKGRQTSTPQTESRV
jgi:hypothetical protein